MVKSRAAIQKAYRQRLKEKDNAKYLREERLRRKSTYIPSGELGRKEHAKRNQKNRDYLVSYRAKKKALAQERQERIDNMNADNEGQNTSGYDTSTSSAMAPQAGPSRMVIQMQFPARARGSRVRMQNELRKYKNDVKEWKQKYDSLQKKYRHRLKTIQRCRSVSQDPDQLTPRSKTDNQLRNLGLNKQQSKEVRKQLLFTNVLCNEVEDARKQTRTHHRHKLHGLVGGRILKKYRCVQMASKRTGLSRNKLGSTLNKGTTIEKLRRRREVCKHKENVKSFMERDDNSRMLPGKKDCKKDNNEKKQTRVLTDYMSNIHRKFLAENPETKLSLASFCRIRPKNILLASFISRSTCLCTRHQNMSLTLKSARSENVKVSVNAEKMLDTKEDFIEEIKETVKSNEIAVSQWKRVAVEEKGKKKMVMRIVEQKLTKEEFISHTELQTKDFEAHVNRVRTQYEEIRRLKDNLPENNVIVQMDFAENYSCKALNEIQSAYWNMTNVTLHPFVAYYRPAGTTELKHKSFVIVSDELSHCSSTVLTFIESILREVRLICPDVTCVHYWTDSPTSQYRNKYIFFEVANHKETHGCYAKWNYFESGHGKGPCDGLGGVTKRMADDAVNTGKATIQNPQDFFAWTQSDKCNLLNIKFLFVTKEECGLKATKLNQMKDIKAISGTMKIHAVTGHGNSEVSLRDTSCYCTTCLSEDITCGSWRRETIEKVKTRGTGQTVESVIEEPRENIPEIITNEPETVPYQIDDYVAAMYSGHWYVGKITDIDEGDLEVEISFMERKKGLFQWPGRPDIIWMKYTDILITLLEPVPTGKTKRLFKLADEDKVNVEQRFKERCGN